MTIDDDKRSVPASGADSGVEPTEELANAEVSDKPVDGEQVRIGPDAGPPEHDAAAGAPAPEAFGRSYESLVTYATPPNTPALDKETAGESPDEALADEEIQRKLDQIPPEPGVYLLRDKAGKVLYVGKAKSLRSRVRAYFRDGGDTRFQVRFLMSRVRDFETLVTSNEKEALILENNLIKQYRPRYNIRLKDDKSYLSAKVTKHAWPRIMVTRKIVKDGGRYFGPFGSADGLRETLDIIRKVFPLRTCSDAVFRNRSRPCLEYQIKRCLGPCCLPVDRDEYKRHLDAAIMLLEGRDLELLKAMREQMKTHAERLEFEEAAKLRDRVRAIEKTVEKQTVLHHWGIDQDVFGLYREGGFIEAIVLMVRRGKLTSTQSWSFEDLEFSDHDILADLLTQFYSGGRYLPDEVLVPVELEDAEVRAELLSERRGKKVMLAVPQRGEKTRLLQMANENARQSFAARRDSEKTRERMLEELRVKLRLRNTPKRIECYDISNLQGSMVVASQVVFDEGLARKDLYRRYRMRTVDGQDDFASMSEVLNRRLARAVKDQDYPDLIIVDGGKGQLNMALHVLRELGLDRSDRYHRPGQTACAQRTAPTPGGQVRGAGVHPQPQGSDHPEAEFQRLVPAGADSRRGPSVCDHLQPRIAPARPAAHDSGRHRGHRTGAGARAVAAFRQPEADSSGKRGRNCAGKGNQSRPGGRRAARPRRDDRGARFRGDSRREREPRSRKPARLATASEASQRERGRRQPKQLSLDWKQFVHG